MVATASENASLFLRKVGFSFCRLAIEEFMKGILMWAGGEFMRLARR
jgi:hypothetical protein